MSSRERWIIYPLLFFAFCLAARDQLPYLRPRVVKIPRLSCQVIESKRIDSDIIKAVNLTGDTIESKKRLKADTFTVNEMDTGLLQCERIVAKSVDDRRLAELVATDTGAGQLTLYGPGERPAIVLSPDADSGTLKSVNADGSQFALQAQSRGGTLVVLDAEDHEIGRYRLEFEPAAPLNQADDGTDSPSKEPEQPE